MKLHVDRIRAALAVLVTTLIAMVGGGRWSTDASPTAETASTAGVTQAFISPSSKVCQLTGDADRGRPGSPTGVALGGGTFGANATDIGYAFRDPYRNRLVFPFGDTHQFPTDRCEHRLEYDRPGNAVDRAEGRRCRARQVGPRDGDTHPRRHE